MCIGDTVTAWSILQNDSLSLFFSIVFLHVFFGAHLLCNRLFICCARCLYWCWFWCYCCWLLFWRGYMTYRKVRWYEEKLRNFRTIWEVGWLQKRLRDLRRGCVTWEEVLWLIKRLGYMRRSGVTSGLQKGSMTSKKVAGLEKRLRELKRYCVTKKEIV